MADLKLTTETLRLIRHAVVPAVTYLVATGYLPPELSGSVTELAVVAVSYLAVMLWSKWREAQG